MTGKRVKRRQVGTSLGVEQRLEFIEFRLFWEGHVKRSDVMTQFGLSMNQASSDLSRYIGFAPHNMGYDRSLQTYVRQTGFRPVFDKFYAGRYLAQLRSIAGGIFDQNACWAFGLFQSRLCLCHSRVSPISSGCAPNRWWI